jgi:hypothetical protein
MKYAPILAPGSNQGNPVFVLGNIIDTGAHTPLIKRKRNDASV